VKRLAELSRDPRPPELSLANQIVSVIQTVLAAQLVSKGGMLANVGDTSDGDKR
jgi:hypothetical protein